PDRHTLAAVRVARARACVHTLLFEIHLSPRPDSRGLDALNLLPEFLGRLRPGDQLPDRRVLGREEKRGTAEDRVDPRGETADGLLESVYSEVSLGPNRLADPVL